MNARERVRAVLEHRIPDSVPRGIYDVMIDNTTVRLKNLVNTAVFAVEDL